jgi:hypothetical protein
MTDLLTEAFKKSQSLPDYLQDELAAQLIEDIENELQWQQQLSQPQNYLLDKLALQVLNESRQGKTKVMGFDELRSQN